MPVEKVVERIQIKEIPVVQTEERVVEMVKEVTPARIVNAHPCTWESNSCTQRMDTAHGREQPAEAAPRTAQRVKEAMRACRWGVHACMWVCMEAEERRCARTRRA